jgi:hypothetical protein
VVRSAAEGAAVRLRAGEDVVLVGLVAGAFDRLVLLRERGGPAQVVAQPRELERVAMQISLGGLDDLVLGRDSTSRCARAGVAWMRGPMQVFEGDICDG